MVSKKSENTKKSKGGRKSNHDETTAAHALFSYANPHSGTAGGMGGTQRVKERSFELISYDAVARKDIEFIVPGMIPADSTVVLVGEEGIGKSLLVYWMIACLTTGKHCRDVLLVAAEDDPERVIRGRLESAGADLSKVHVLASEPDSLTGHPQFPTDIPSVQKAIVDRGISVVFIDPWLAVVPGNLQVKDTQQARLALGPINRLAREAHVAVVLVTHTNRQTIGGTRGRYGATIALRQASRFCMMAIEDPSDPSALFVGIEKTNLGERENARRFEKVVEGETVRLVESDTEVGFRIDQLLAAIDQDPEHDQRTSDRWVEVESAARESEGRITRQQIIRIYEEAGSTAKAADKALERWTAAPGGRLERGEERGSYRLIGLHPVPPVLRNGDERGVA